MTDRTQQLIADLVTQLVPVRPLRPPFVRALLWLAAISAFAAALILSPAHTVQRTTYTMTDVELWSMLATAVFGVLAAFELSIPGNSPRWVWAPIPPLIVWIASSGHSCYHLWRIGASAGHMSAKLPDCFLFILIMSVPLAVLLLWMLRRAQPIAPVPVAFTAGTGVAAASAFLLQFFHPFDVTFMDLAVHLSAVALVVGVTAVSGRKVFEK
jgi:hypothetical protein